MEYPYQPAVEALFQLQRWRWFNVEIIDYHEGACIMLKNGLPAIHPGEFLAEILEELGVSQANFAREIGISPMRVSHIVRLCSL